EVARDQHASLDGRDRFDAMLFDQIRSGGFQHLVARRRAIAATVLDAECVHDRTPFSSCSSRRAAHSAWASINRTTALRANSLGSAPESSAAIVPICARLSRTMASASLISRALMTTPARSA